MKWERWMMVQALPGEQPNTDSTTSHEKNNIRMYVVHTPGYVNHSVFRFRSVVGAARTYKFAISKKNSLFSNSSVNHNKRFTFRNDVLLGEFWLCEIWAGKKRSKRKERGRRIDQKSEGNLLGWGRVDLIGWWSLPLVIFSIITSYFTSIVLRSRQVQMRIRIYLMWFRISYEPNFNILTYIFNVG